MAKYELKLSLGDQDYLTVLGWEDPHLFHILDCRQEMTELSPWSGQ